MKNFNIVFTIVFLIIGTNAIMAQSNHSYKEAYRPIKSHIADNENIIELKKVKIKGTQIKIENKNKFKEEIPLLLRSNLTFRFYLSSLESNDESILFKLKDDSGKDSEILISLSSDHEDKKFIYEDIQFKKNVANIG